MQSFQELNLSPLLLRAIKEMGYEKPSQIQAEALPILLGESTDFMGLAATGTGKTAAFSIPLLERVDPNNRDVQGLILCPTRELALQVAGQINLMNKYMGIKALAVYGGSSFGDQVYGLKKGAAIVVGTPGRVVDHLERGTLRLDGVRTVILDEADEMISMGFKDDLELILSKAPREENNIWLFSATMSPEVRRVADTYLRNPEQVQVNRTEMVPDTIEQLYYKTHEGDKPEILCKLIDAADDFYGLVFCQTKNLVVDLTQYLKGRGYLTDCLHGDMDQDARERTMRGFRERRVKVLVCTDVASRGLDVKDVTHVVNYSLPRELDNYVHRIGRTARSGKHGVAMSLVTPSHKALIGRIERLTKSRMNEGKIPSRRELGAKKVTGALDRFMDQPLYTRAIEVMSDDWKEALAGMTAEEVAGRFLSSLYPEVFSDTPAGTPPAKAPKRAAAVAPLASPVVETAVVVEKPSVVAKTAVAKAPVAKKAEVVAEPVAPVAESVMTEVAAPVAETSAAQVVAAAPSISAAAASQKEAVLSAPAPLLYMPAELLAEEDAPKARGGIANRPLTRKKKKDAAAPAVESTSDSEPAAVVVKPAAVVSPESAPQPWGAPREKREGGFAGKRKFGDKREGGFGAKREGGFGGKREGGFGAKREGGFGGKREGSFGGKREGGFGAKREGSFGAKREGSFGAKREGGFGAPREGGFGEKREGGFGAKRDWAKKRPFGQPGSGFVGRAPRPESRQDDGMGLGRAPQESGYGRFAGKKKGGFQKSGWGAKNR